RDHGRAVRGGSGARRRAGCAHGSDAGHRMGAHRRAALVSVARRSADAKNLSRPRAVILKLKQTPGVYLIGFMGSGKTTIGRLLADRLGWNFVDIDEQIEAREQRSISDIFDSMGEPAFRGMETAEIAECVRAVSCGRPTVIALGGGAAAQPGNFELLENHGVTIWLSCPFEMVVRR